MSSSVFIEPSVQLPEDGQASDANLVVVYGKTGVNIDPNDLERLIEEKTVQSISVLRLTSPTPSMEDAEEAERLEEEKNLQESAAESEEATDAEANESKRRDASVDSDEKSNTETEDESDMSAEQSRDEESSDHEASLVKKRSKNRKNKKLLTKDKTNASTKPRAELVGLRFEGFYEAEAALEIAKEACKMAGIPFVRNTAEHEALLLVIRNDHCYTPFTSPEQMKAKLAADKQEAEEIAANARKVQPQLTCQAKQVMLMKARKPLAGSPSSVMKTGLKNKTDGLKERRAAQEKSNEQDDDMKLTSSADDFDEEEETYELIDIESDYSASEQTDESDNDRDSDLDFDVNNRQLKKRKVPQGLKKARKQTVSKQMSDKRPEERAMPSNAKTFTASTSSQRPAVAGKARIGVNNTPTMVQRQGRSPQTMAIDITQRTPTSNASVTTHGGITKVVVNKLFARPSLTITPKIQRPVQVTQIATSQPSSSNTPQDSSKRAVNVARADVGSPKQNVKEIVLNKVMSSPKGGFTELSTLISAEEMSHKQREKIPSKPAASIIQNVITNVASTSGTASSRGFMRIDAASKNQLPAQISIETHHSSNELAAEHDKQLDLIDSIVKDELNKSLEKEIVEKPSIGIDENIPKLVEMLESTEKALVSNTTTNTQTTRSLNTSLGMHPENVDDIDMSHGLPEDLLQHVVELIEDDKTLKEAVEKQILEEQSFRHNSDDIAGNQTTDEQQQQKASSTVGTAFTSLPLAQLNQSMPLVSLTQPSATRSIIQMSISNISSPTPTLSSSPSYTPKSSPLVRRDPIQIVRGNGRVITLPPIEAPTTRAKRRAQTVPSSTGQQTPVQHSSDQTNAIFLNESSLDSSVHSNASFSAIPTTTTAMLSMTTPLLDETFGAPSDKKQQEPLAKRRLSKEGKATKKAVASKANTKKAAVTAILQHEDAEASESQGDDDDPNKLWCICRQPHNNRFMICCDGCGDWFHGKCVNITKAMGREMEQKGKEWTCPLCKKKQEDKQQRKITDMLQVKRSNSQSSTISVDKPKAQGVNKTLSSDISSTTGEDEKMTAFSVNKDTSLPKKVESGTFVVLKTPTSTKKAQISLNEGEKKLQTNKTIGQNKVKLLATTPVRSTPNIQMKSPQTSRSDNAPSHKTMQSVTLTKVSNVSTVACVVCKKPARPSSVYCSDDCIRRCAQNAINVIAAKSSEQIVTGASNVNTLDDKKKKSKGLFEDLLAMPDRKPKIERITVYERKSGTKLSGSNAPTTITIKKWLLDNPTYEIVLPGSQLSQEIEQKQHQQQRTPIVQKAAESAIRTPVLGVDKEAVKPTKTTPSAATGQVSAPQRNISSPALKTPKQIVDEHRQLSQRSSTPKQLQKVQQQVQTKSAKEETKQKERQQLKRHLSESGSSGSSSKRKSADSANTSSSSDPEPIRMNVRRTLKNEILQRMRESTGSESPRLTTEEVEAFVKQTESEMYNYFNRDTGQKYRNKYRSLMFNIKDRKNRTLFAKICAKQIEPKQLVHMSGAELASQELAKWREEENKHQLEMIKKSELEMLSCTKNYLFKNHKGEEVIESKETDVCVNLDITTPVEDLVNVLNSSTPGLSSSEHESNEPVVGSSPTKQVTSPIVSGGDDMSPQAESEHHQHSQHHIHQHHHHQQQSEEKSKIRGDPEKEHRSKSREHDRHKNDRDERERERREKRHRSRSRDRQRERHHRDKSRSRRRSHSRSKSRSRSQERRHKNVFKDERRERERERERDNKDRKKTGTEHKAPASSTTTTPTSKTPSNVVTQIQQKDKHHRHSPVVVTKQKQSTPLECFNLIDQIIESSKTVEEAANLVKDKEKLQDKPKVEQKTVQPTSSTSLASHEAVAAQQTVAPKRVTSTSDSDQEPTSTVSIPTPPREEPRFSRTNSPNTDLEIKTLWTGPITMNEVATLHINIQPLIGNSQYVGQILPQALDVVGRIDNQTVWEYLWKIRKSPNKEIVLIRLTPLSDDDIDGYAKLFSYLDQKKRLGVVKSITPQIKDIYIFPLGSGKQLPKVLQVANEHDFYDDPYRADVIVGILVCVLGKQRSAASIPSTSTAQVSSSAHFSSSSVLKHARRHRVDATDSFTPPGSPKRKKRANIDLDAIIKAPIVRKPAATTALTALADDADEPYSPGGSSDEDLVSMYTAKPPPTVLLGLASADEELKRKMEEINRQIAAQEIEIAGLLNAETTGASASVLANISIPSNLPQILASINKGKEVPSTSTTARTHTETNQTNKMTQQMSSTTAFGEYNSDDTILTSKTSAYMASATQPIAAPASTSRLAQLSEAELLSMVPDDVLMEPAPKQPASSSYYKEPPPPGV